MLTTQDIKKIVHATTEAGKEIFATKSDLQELREELKGEFRTLQTSVDKFAKKIVEHDEAIKILNNKVFPRK